jgi:hypothetical protein
MAITLARTFVDQFMPALDSPAQGEVLYFNGTTWVALGVGTSGQFLQSQGAAANVQWASLTSEEVESYTSLGTGATKTFAPAALTTITKIEVAWVDLSGNGTNRPLLQIGTSSAVETSGYVGHATYGIRRLGG